MKVKFSGKGTAGMVYPYGGAYSGGRRTIDQAISIRLFSRLAYNCLEGRAWACGVRDPRTHGRNIYILPGSYK